MNPVRLAFPQSAHFINEAPAASSMKARARRSDDQGGQRACRQNRRAVTLVEMLMVLGLMGLMMSLALPGLHRWQRSLPMNRAVATLQLQLQETRVSAIRAGEAWCLELPSKMSTGKRLPMSSTGSPTEHAQFRMPDGIRCEVLQVDSRDDTAQRSEVRRIVFYADGTVEPAVIRIIADDGATTTMRVNRLTGSASIMGFAASKANPLESTDAVQGVHV